MTPADLLVGLFPLVMLVILLVIFAGISRDLREANRKGRARERHWENWRHGR